MDSPERRLPFRLEWIDSRRPPDNFVWISVDATLDLLLGISWGGRELPRSSAMELSPPTHPSAGDECLIGERELTGAVSAAMRGSGRNGRGIILRTDNQNVSRWEGSARARAPASGRLRRALNLFCLAYQVGIIFLMFEAIITVRPTGWPVGRRRAWIGGQQKKIRHGPTRLRSCGEIWPCLTTRPLWSLQSRILSRYWLRSHGPFDPRITVCANGNQSALVSPAF